MNAELIGQVGLVLGSVGGAMQWLRAYKGFPELAYYALAALLSGLALWFVNEAAVTGLKAYIGLFVANWPVFLTFLGVTMGGTKTVSDAAKSGMAFAPMTNSR